MSHNFADRPLSFVKFQREVPRLPLTTESRGWPAGRAESSRRRADGDGEEQREHQQVHEHPGDRSACLEAVLGGLATCEQADAVVQLAGSDPRAAAAGYHGLGGATHDDEGGGACGSTRESSGRRGCGGGKLGQPAMAAEL